MAPFEKRKNKEGHGRLAERQVNKRLGTSLVPASGAIEGLKGDLKNEDFLIENKSTVKQSMGIKKGWLHKIANEATDIGRRPALSFQFVNSLGESKPEDRWICIRECDYEELIEK